MCWHICNNCNEIHHEKHGHNDPDPRPCIWFIPGVDESGLQGCPYFIPDEDNDMVDPACWVAVPFSKIRELIGKFPSCYMEDSDSALDEEEQKANKKIIKRLVG